ncbi:MAG: type II secretion system F family protein [Desulfuromonadales bacterium]|nr:type II secretion system F family protein [Desulfuromonadales bacterium]
MPSFRCKIGTADGRVVEKDFNAADREILRESLEEQGFFVFRISNRSLNLFSHGSHVRVSGRRLLTLNQELIALLRSGLPILQALDTLIERMEAGALLEALQDIRESIKGGASLSEAFEKYPHIFSNLYIAALRAGERTGDLPVMLKRHIEYQKRVESLKAKVRKESFYPLLLMGAVCGVVLFLMLYVIPTFSRVFADANMELPFLTRVLITVAHGLAGSVIFWLPLLLAAIWGGRIYLRSVNGMLLRDKIKLKLFFFGKLFADYALSNFCRTLETTLASGVPLVQSMQMSRGALNNRILEEKLKAATRQVEEGGEFSVALERTGFVPLIALRMLAVGEAGGSLELMLSEVADYYEAEVEQRLDRLTTLIEPILMLTMGVVVGGIIVAMYIPIFQLAGTAG